MLLGANGDAVLGESVGANSGAGGQRWHGERGMEFSEDTRLSRYSHAVPGSIERASVVPKLSLSSWTLLRDEIRRLTLDFIKGRLACGRSLARAFPGTVR